MKIHSFQLEGWRCFSDTGEILLSRSVNIIVGQNNSGKSTILQGITSWQINPFQSPDDIRPGSTKIISTITVAENRLGKHTFVYAPAYDVPLFKYKMDLLNNFTLTAGGTSKEDSQYVVQVGAMRPIFSNSWPDGPIVPFFAKRKATAFVHDVSNNAQTQITGTFQHLYSKIDRVSSPGTIAHDFYQKAVVDILGIYITTKASDHGKEAGYYFDDDNFVTLQRMGDGVSEIVALIVEISLAKDKIFVLEEPETNLHPKGLKALCNLIRDSSSRNQFIIATHSNIVVRELAVAGTEVFRVSRHQNTANSDSQIAPIEDTPVAHRELLRELGYEFGDLDLHDCWLFLEEASVETIIRQFLIPWFAPKLAGRLRTFSVAGVDNLEPSISEFQRLVTFVHLEPVYRDKLWIRADGDEPGKRIIESIKSKFNYFSATRADTFSLPHFELYYPEKFSDVVSNTLSISDRRRKREQKAILLNSVIAWTVSNPEISREAWAVSAAEHIRLLVDIEKSIVPAA